MFHISFDYKSVFSALHHVSRDTFSVIAWIGVILLLLFLWWRVTDIDLAYGNLWATFMNIQITLYILFCLLFWIFVAASLYKFRYFWWMIDKKNTTVGSVWWLFWILVAGCPVCAFSIASYVWLAWLISLLPRYWLELKVLWLCFVVYATRNVLLNIDTCTFSPSKK